MTVVIDASFLIEGLDPDSPNAARAGDLRKRLAKELLLAPALLIWEVGNFVSRIVAQPVRETAADVGSAAGGFTEDIQLDVPDAQSISRTIEIAVRHRLTFYDASYLELASRHEGSILLSQDKALRQASQHELGPTRVHDLFSALERFAP